MRTLTLKPTHKAVVYYYTQLRNFKELNVVNESALASLFAKLLKLCARQFAWNLIERYSIKRCGQTIRVDGVIIDDFNLIHGIWEAKDGTDDLEKEIGNKFDTGSPSENILFQAPERIIIVQNGREVFNDLITDPQSLICALKIFFEEYRPREFLQWEKTAEEFKNRTPEIGRRLLKQIETARADNKRFIGAFNDFFDLCRQTINPELSVQAVEEMLIQHLLTERIFRNVFKNADFVNRNIIAREIEKVIDALASQYFSRDEFLRDLDRFYLAIETTAGTLVDYSEKQHFLNTIYEKFFQGFSVKVADTHGIVYTPQPIVDFMVRSVEEILGKEFNKSLSDEGVHILDPFVGAGNFILRVMHDIKRHNLLYKYEKELHCNEVMLLPYYIASMNIEHAYFEMTGAYLPFEGICLADTFEIAEGLQISNLDILFSKENTARVRRQKEAPIFVIIGNPPHNAGRVNENDDNKNRTYPIIDKRVADTYAHDSKATNKNALSDFYIKAIRWATDRIKQTGEGIVAFISNNRFIDDITFDGMRKHLADDFSAIYHLNLKGNARTSGERRRREGGNVLDDAIRDGVGITFFVRKKGEKGPARISIHSIDDYMKSSEKKSFLEKNGSCAAIQFTEVKSNKNNVWLTSEMNEDFETLLPMGSKEAKAADNPKTCFKLFSNGVKTNRDAWVYNFSEKILSSNAKRFIGNYNSAVFNWVRLKDKPEVDDFVSNDDTEISWSEGLKNYLQREIPLEFQTIGIRTSVYRPFTKQFLYFDQFLIERRYQFASIYPTIKSETQNSAICVSAVGNTKSFHCLMTNVIPDLHLTGDTQCFPFYTYDEYGSRRRDNITDWLHAKFRFHYSDTTISKWDIFYYIYAVLHHSRYRSKYAANLRRFLPRIPYAPDFKGFAEAGKRLADLHVNYEAQKEFQLEFIENETSKLNWRVEKMQLSKDKTRIVYNDFLTLAGIPAEVFEYRLGNRSALDWILDQYRISTDRRSGIVNDPNNPDDPEYIVKLIGKVITVSLETVKIVKNLPELEAGAIKT
jgi:predicted helicase